MLKLKLQYFGHLMWRTDSLEKTLILRKSEDKRRRHRQRMKWLDGITDLHPLDGSRIPSPSCDNQTGLQFNSVHSSPVQLFATPWTIAHQASLSLTISQILLKYMSIESVTPSNHLILCHPLASFTFKLYGNTLFCVTLVPSSLYFLRFIHVLRGTTVYLCP